MGRRRGTPIAEAQNTFLKSHSWEEYGEWRLG